MKLKSGQMWKNTRTAVQIQEAEGEDILAVTFKITGRDTLEFSHAYTFNENGAQSYLKKHRCKLTDKVLTAS